MLFHDHRLYLNIYKYTYYKAEMDKQLLLYVGTHNFMLNAIIQPTK